MGHPPASEGTAAGGESGAGIVRHAVFGSAPAAREN